LPPLVGGWHKQGASRADYCCCLLSAGAGLQPVLVHLSKNKEGKFSFDPISVNLLTEVAKSLFALSVLLLVVSGAPDSSTSLHWVLWQQARRLMSMDVVCIQQQQQQQQQRPESQPQPLSTYS
jgi:hypothetical protein